MIQRQVSLAVLCILVAAFGSAVEGQTITPRLGWFSHVQPVRPGYGSGFDSLMIRVSRNSPLPAGIDSIKFSVVIRQAVIGIGCVLSRSSGAMSSLPGTYVPIDPVTNCFGQTPSGCSYSLDVSGCLSSSQSMTAKIVACNSSPSCRDSIVFNTLVVEVKEQLADQLVPREFKLDQNYPNPFNPSTAIRYGLPSQSKVRLTITNTLGQEVAVLENGEREPGYHEVEWHANVASGVYFYNIDAVCTSDPNNRFVQVKQMLLLK